MIRRRSLQKRGKNEYKSTGSGPLRFSPGEKQKYQAFCGQQLKRIGELDGIVVNSNDEEMLKIAQRLGCETVKRDPYYASSEVSMSDVYQNMAQNMDADVIAYINVTNPLIRDETIVKAVRTYYDHRDDHDSLNSAHLIKEFLFQDHKPINYDLKHQPRSQDLPDIAALNFAVSILERETMIRNKNVVGSRPEIFLIDETEATDIDNSIDFEFAEYMYKNYYQKLSGDTVSGT